jgi:hypothetical protein
MPFLLDLVVLVCLSVCVKVGQATGPAAPHWCSPRVHSRPAAARPCRSISQAQLSCPAFLTIVLLSVGGWRKQCERALQGGAARIMTRCIASPLILPGFRFLCCLGRRGGRHQVAGDGGRRALRVRAPGGGEGHAPLGPAVAIQRQGRKADQLCGRRRHAHPRWAMLRVAPSPPVSPELANIELPPLEPLGIRSLDGNLL